MPQVITIEEMTHQSGFGSTRAFTSAFRHSTGKSEATFAKKTSREISAKSPIVMTQHDSLCANATFHEVTGYSPMIVLPRKLERLTNPWRI